MDNNFSLGRVIRACLANSVMTKIAKNESILAQVFKDLRIDEDSALVVDNLISKENSVEVVLNNNPDFVEELKSYDSYSSNKAEYLDFMVQLINELLNDWGDYSYVKTIALKFPSFIKSFNEELNLIYRDLDFKTKAKLGIFFYAAYSNCGVDYEDSRERISNKNKIEAYFFFFYEDFAFSQNKVILKNLFWKSLPYLPHQWAQTIAEFHESGIILFQSPDWETIRYIARFNSHITRYIVSLEYPSSLEIGEAYLQELSPFWEGACEELGRRGIVLKYPDLCNKISFFIGVENLILSGLDNDINKGAFLYKKTSNQFTRRVLWRKFYFSSYGWAANPSNPLLEEIPTFLALIWGEETPLRSFEDFAYQEAIDAIAEIKEIKKSLTLENELI